MIGYGKTVEMLYAGMNEDFRTFRPQYLTYMTQFTYAFEHGYDYVTMGGVEGTLKDGLSVYKSNFNPVVNEFIGEFDLPVNKLLFKPAQKAYEMLKKRNSSD
jgi:serine/alanine adding enzyme